jgi:hypothetical protein
MRVAARGDLYEPQIPLQTIFNMSESWFRYHIEKWCYCKDDILSDLSQRLRDRRLLKTFRLSNNETEAAEFIEVAKETSRKLGFDPNYYVSIIGETDGHRGHDDETLEVITESGDIVAAEQVEPLIAALPRIPRTARRWLVVPREVKAALL